MFVQFLTRRDQNGIQGELSGLSFKYVLDSCAQCFRIVARVQRCAVYRSIQHGAFAARTHVVCATSYDKVAVRGVITNVPQSRCDTV